MGDRTPARIIHALAGAPAFEGCADVDPCRCWMCADTSTRAMPISEWQGASFTDQNKCRSQGATMICEACAWACSWVVPPGHEPPPPGKKGVNLRLFSHLYDAGQYRYANKADKPAIRAWLRAPKRGPWFAAIADTGQKHIIPWTPMNLGSHGAVLFEERLIELPRTDDEWRILDDAIALLTAGATKEELERGEYRADTWRRCSGQIRDFEEAHSGLRGGAFFALVVWLAQRDDEAVAARVDAEKAAKAAKKEVRSGKTTRRQTAGRPGREDRGGDHGAPRDVPRERRKRAQALDANRGPDPRGVSDDGEPRGVGHVGEEEPANSGIEQLSLFGDSGARG